jgi:peptide/nickel transport system permease protein
MTPRRSPQPSGQSPSERAAAAEAAKRFELDEASFGGGLEDAQEMGVGTTVLSPDFDTEAAELSGVVASGVRFRGAEAPLDEAVDRPPTGEIDRGVDAGAPQGKRTPRWRQMLEVFFQNKLAVLSLVVLALIVLFVYIGPFFYRTNQTNTNAILQTSSANLPPSWAHPLGTDITGWDVLGRLMYGGKYSLTLGLLAGLITIVVGTVYGMVSGFFGGVTDGVMMRVIDAALSIPYLFLLVALVSVFGPTTTLLILAIGLTGWWGNSRIIRGDALTIRDLEYSVASRSMGGSKLHVIRRHVFPNSISNIVTVSTFSVADAILALSALGFIGLGVEDTGTGTDWGYMMYEGSQQLVNNNYWWELYPVAIIFVLVLLCINYIGDALRDVFEVRLRLR